MARPSRSRSSGSSGRSGSSGSDGSDSGSSERGARRRQARHGDDDRRQRGRDRAAGDDHEPEPGPPPPPPRDAGPVGPPAPPAAAAAPKPPARPSRTGGVYIPPFKLAQMMQEVEDKTSAEYQRLTWDALKKSINGLVNKVSATNIKDILPEIFSENLVRGRGLFARSVMKSQMASPQFSNVFAALVAVVNTKFPELGELVLKRVVLQFRRSYKRNDKPVCIAAIKFLAQLINQQVVHELLALELLTVLLQQPTDDSVEVAIEFIKDVGHTLGELTPQGLHGVFERFRGILHEGVIDKRVQFMIEGLFALRKAKFEGRQGIPPELDLVEEDDQIVHEVSLDDQLQADAHLDVFREDPDYAENEARYQQIKKEILGGDSGDDGSGSSSSSESESDDEQAPEPTTLGGGGATTKINDMTETNMVNLRRTIYLTIVSSLDFEEAGHKLMKLNLPQGQEMELCVMIIECCAQERTYIKYYGLLAQRFCFVDRVYQQCFDECFMKQYATIHRLETNKLRNVARLFAHLVATDGLSWACLAYLQLTEDTTTSSSRIFIKLFFQELSEHLGLRKLNERLRDPAMQDYFMGIFPKDSPRNMRFAINFFTQIGLGGVTDDLRAHLAETTKRLAEERALAAEKAAAAGSGSDSDSSTTSSSDDSDSDSDSSGSSSSSSGSGSSDSSSSSDSESTPPRKRRKRSRSRERRSRSRDRDRDRRRDERRDSRDRR